MTIGRKLVYVIVLWVVLLLGLSGVILVAFGRMAVAQQRAEIATEFAKGVLELNLLTYDYLDGREARAAQQWQSRHDSLGRILAEIEAPTGPTRDVLIKARSGIDDLRLFFARLTRVRADDRWADNPEARAEYEYRLAGQLQSMSHSLASLATRLSRLSAADATRTADRARMLMLALAAVATGLAAGALAHVAISVNRRIRRLREGAVIVGNGNLGYRVDLRVNDEIGELSRAFDAMTERLAAASEMKSKFIRVAGHELRTPLSYIMAMPKLLENVDDPDKLRDAVRKMEAKGRRLSEIVQSMFKLMAEEDYSEHLNLGDVAMSDIIDKVRRDCEPFADERDQTLAVEVSDGLPKLNVDRYKIRDVIENLVGNAIKFTPAGGTITVRTDRPDDAHVSVSVTDQGPGIPPEDLPYIFDPFFSTGDVMKHSSGSIAKMKHGIGLGLAVVKHFTEMHGGEVVVDSSDQGAIFTMTLPIRTPVAAA